MTGRSRSGGDARPGLPDRETRGADDSGPGRCDLSVTIVSYHVRRLLADCLRSVYRETRGISFEVVVIDNASTDGSADMVAQDFPQAILLRNQENAGFARANNAAIRRSRGRYVLLLNPDTVVYEGALQKMVACMDQHPEAAGMGPRVTNEDGSLQMTAYHRFPAIRDCCFTVRMARAALRRILGGRYRGEPLLSAVRPQKAAWIMGCCLLLRSEALDEIGLLDERFFLGGEELDWCYRAGQSGWKLYYCPSCGEVLHYGGRSRARIEDASRQAMDAVADYLRKHYGNGWVGWFRALISVDVVLSLVAASLAMVLRPGRVSRKKFKEYGSCLRWSLGL